MIRAKNDLEVQFGYENYYGDTFRNGWVLNYSLRKNTNGEMSLDVYFVDEWSENFKINMPFYMSFLVKPGNEETREYFLRRYEREIVKIEDAERYNVSEYNHLNQPPGKYLRVWARTESGFQQMLQDIRGISKKDYTSMYEDYCMDRNDKFSIHEYDIPLEVLAGIDFGIRCGKWYAVRYDGEKYWIEESRLLIPPEMRILAFDIETTKEPLKFPDPKRDSIVMISVTTSDAAMVIVNGEAVGKDVCGFDYEPREDIKRRVRVVNERNEEGVLLRFIETIQRERPHIVTTYNGGMFDFPFIEIRCGFYNISLEETTSFKKSKEYKNTSNARASHKDNNEETTSFKKSKEYKNTSNARASHKDNNEEDNSRDGKNNGKSDRNNYNNMKIYNAESYWDSSFILHMDCYKWVKRDSYLPMNNQGLKDATRIKLGYSPDEIDPEEMMTCAAEDPQRLVSYAVSDAVATYFLYLRYVHSHIFSIGSLVPRPTVDILCKGSGTLCEALLFSEARRYKVLVPNARRDEDLGLYEGHIVTARTYVGGHVESLRAGVFRSDFEHEFTIDTARVHDIIAQIDEIMHDVAYKDGYTDARIEILRKLEDLLKIKRSLGTIWHLDVAAMYPNIIITNRLQPISMVDEDRCIHCDFNDPQNKCKRNMDWTERTEYLPPGPSEIAMIKATLKNTKYIGKNDKISFDNYNIYKNIDCEFDDLPIKQLREKVTSYSRKIYKKIKEVDVRRRTSTVCQREIPFYVETVRKFRDQRDALKVKYREAMAAYEQQPSNENRKTVMLYNSLQIAYKCVLNSFYGYAMRTGSRWFSLEMAAVVCHEGGRIIRGARQLIEQIGIPLELDTDGIWCLLPAGFPCMVTVGDKKINFFARVINHFISRQFSNPQYQTLIKNTDDNIKSNSNNIANNFKRNECSIKNNSDSNNNQDNLNNSDSNNNQDNLNNTDSNNNQDNLNNTDSKWVIEERNSIRFDADGPYKTMFIPSSTEKGRLLKKRYVVFDWDGQIAELKGFELKRRGELNFIKKFQDDLFTRLGDGNTLEECYRSLAECCNYWYDLLSGDNEALDDMTIFDLLSESRNLSKNAGNFGERKSNILNTARRLAEFLGEDVLEEKMKCEFIVGRFPENAPTAERCIPTLVFKSPDAHKYLRKWLGNDRTNLHEIIDWDYYIRRYESILQRMVIIPAYCQGIQNPLPRVEMLQWIRDDCQKKLFFTSNAMDTKENHTTDIKNANNNVNKINDSGNSILDIKNTENVIKDNYLNVDIEDIGKDISIDDLCIKDLGIIRKHHRTSSSYGLKNEIDNLMKFIRERRKSWNAFFHTGNIIFAISSVSDGNYAVRYMNGRREVREYVRTVFLKVNETKYFESFEKVTLCLSSAMDPETFYTMRISESALNLQRYKKFFDHFAIQAIYNYDIDPIFDMTYTTHNSYMLYQHMPYVVITSFNYMNQKIFCVTALDSAHGHLNHFKKNIIEEKDNKVIGSIEEKDNKVIGSIEEKDNKVIGSIEEKDNKVIGSIEEKDNKVIESIEEKDSKLIESIKSIGYSKFINNKGKAPNSKIKLTNNFSLQRGETVFFCPDKKTATSCKIMCMSLTEFVETLMDFSLFLLNTNDENFRLIISVLEQRNILPINIHSPLTLSGLAGIFNTQRQLHQKIVAEFRVLAGIAVFSSIPLANVSMSYSSTGFLLDSMLNNNTGNTNNSSNFTNTNFLFNNASTDFKFIYALDQMFYNALIKGMVIPEISSGAPSSLFRDETYKATFTGTYSLQLECTESLILAIIEYNNPEIHPTDFIHATSSRKDFLILREMIKKILVAAIKNTPGIRQLFASLTYWLKEGSIFISKTLREILIVIHQRYLVNLVAKLKHLQCKIISVSKELIIIDTGKITFTDATLYFHYLIKKIHAVQGYELLNLKIIRYFKKLAFITPTIYFYLSPTEKDKKNKSTFLTANNKGENDHNKYNTIHNNKDNTDNNKDNIIHNRDNKIYSFSDIPVPEDFLRIYFDQINLENDFIYDLINTIKSHDTAKLILRLLGLQRNIHGLASNCYKLLKIRSLEPQNEFTSYLTLFCPFCKIENLFRKKCLKCHSAFPKNILENIAERYFCNILDSISSRVCSVCHATEERKLRDYCRCGGKFISVDYSGELEEFRRFINTKKFDSFVDQILIYLSN